MVLATASSRVDYVASAGQVSFPYTFPIFAATDLLVYVSGSLQSTSAYSVTGVGEASGGNVVFTTGRASGDEVILLSGIPYTQGLDYVDGDAFPAAAHEAGLDTLTRLTQQLKEITDRCLQLNVALSYGKTGLELPAPQSLTLSDPANRAVVAWRGDQDNLELVELTTETGLVGDSITTSPYASFPAPAAGKMRLASDTLRGLYYATGSRHIRVGARIFDAQEYGFLPENSAADNDTAMAALLAALPAGGGKIYLPGADVGYQFSATIQPTKQVHILGDNVFSTGLEYTGTGTAIRLTGAACVHSILEGFNLQTTNAAATYGIELDNGANECTLRNLRNVIPATPFANAMVRIGATGNIHSTQIEAVEFRETAPIGIDVFRHVQFLKIINGSRIVHHSDTNIQLGSAGLEADIVRITDSDISSSDAGGTMVRIINAIHTVISGCQLERSGGGYAVDIPATAVEANKVFIERCYLNIATGCLGVVYVESSTASVHLSGNWIRNITGGTLVAVVNNVSCRAVSLHDNHYFGVSDTALAVTNFKGTRFHNNTAPLGNGFSFGGAGGALSTLANSTTITGNVGAGEDTLFTYTLHANRLHNASHTLTVVVGGTCAANANTKNIRIRLNGQLLAATGVVAANGTDWAFNMTLSYLTSTTCRTATFIGHNNTAYVSANTVSGLDFAADTDLTITGEATATNDIQITNATVRLGLN